MPPVAVMPHGLLCEAVDLQQGMLVQQRTADPEDGELNVEVVERFCLTNAFVFADQVQMANPTQAVSQSPQ